MSPLRRTALVAGVLYLLIFVSIPTLAFVRPGARSELHRRPTPCWSFRCRHVCSTSGASSRRRRPSLPPIAVWEFSLGAYLIVKGFKPSPSQLPWRLPDDY
jgi:hypothetical protein